MPVIHSLVSMWDLPWCNSWITWAWSGVAKLVTVFLVFTVQLYSAIPACIYTHICQHHELWQIAILYNHGRHWVVFSGVNLCYQCMYGLLLILNIITTQIYTQRWMVKYQAWERKWNKSAIWSKCLENSTTNPPQIADQLFCLIPDILKIANISQRKYPVYSAKYTHMSRLLTKHDYNTGVLLIYHGSTAKFPIIY